MDTTTFTTEQLVNRLYNNLRTLAPAGQENSYIAGYLINALKSIAEAGIEELIDHVDWTNQRVEAKRKVAA
jgi:hypothetical protein